MFDELLYLLPIVVLSALIYLIASPRSPLAKQGALNFPYQRRERLMTKAEGSFYQVLELALPEEDYRLFGKVRVEDLISVKAGLDFKTRQSFRNRIKSRHIDIVVVERKTFKPVWAIELDDKSHDSPKRKERDTFLDNAFIAAGLPLIRFKVKRSYTTSDIQTALGLDRTSRPEAVPVETPDPESGAGSVPVSSERHPAENLCPRCYARMIKKRVRSGKYAGAEVFACSRYPKCRKLMLADDSTE